MARSSKTLVIGLGGLVATALLIALASRGSDPADEVASRSSTTTTTTATSTSTTSTSTTSSTTTTVTTTTLSPLEEARIRLAEEAAALVASMTVEELAYQLIATGLTGPDVGARLDDTVGSACVGAVFVTETNENWAPVDSADAATTAIGVIRGRAAECASEPFIATDAEFGSIVRVPLTAPPGPPEWTRRYETGAPADVLVAIANEAFDHATALRALGVDLNFGVVGDVDVDPGYFMARSGRTFGADQSTAAALTGAMAEAHCTAGVAPTLKHFPNQGSTVEDPHREVSVAVGGAAAFFADQADPWRNPPAPVVMTGHIVVPDLDSELPASMSPAVTTGLLRDELGYDGVVITDDLSTMRGAIDIVPSAGSRAVNAIHAGADLALFVDDRDVPDVVVALVGQIEADPFFRERAEEAVARTLQLRLRLQDPERFPLCRGVPVITRN